MASLVPDKQISLLFIIDSVESFLCKPKQEMVYKLEAAKMIKAILPWR